jgi:hypothetical protein
MPLARLNDVPPLSSRPEEVSCYRGRHIQVTRIAVGLHTIRAREVSREGRWVLSCVPVFSWRSSKGASYIGSSVQVTTIELALRLGPAIILPPLNTDIRTENRQKLQ